MWFDNWSDIWRICLTTLVIYAALILILRLSGKRSLAKLNIFDLVVTVALGSILASIILTNSIAIIDGIAAFIALTGLQYLVSWASVRVDWFKALIRSDARILLKDGRIIEEALRAERVTHGEIEAAIRKKGHGRIEGIAAVVLETDGELSVIAQGKADECSALRTLLAGDDRKEND